MLDLKNIKIVLFDFDDTLFVHDKHNRARNHAYDYQVDIYSKGVDYYSESGKNLCMQELMDECSYRDIKMGLISAVGFLQSGLVKHDWVQKVYNYDLENFCVSNPEDKTDMLHAVAKLYNLQSWEIMIIDDYWLVLECAEKANFVACTPAEVANWYISQKGVK